MVIEGETTSQTLGSVSSVLSVATSAEPQQELRQSKRRVMYTDTNFPTKKAFKEAVASGKKVRLYAPGLSPHPRHRKQDGTETVEGPHYPKPHSWYARVEVKDGIVVKVT